MKLSRKNFARSCRTSAPMLLDGNSGKPFARLKNGGWARPKEAYYDRDAMYDSFSVAPGVAFPQSTPMFQVPVGTNGKTKAQTNMQMAGMMANGDVFQVTGIRCIVSFNAFPVDAINILQLCFMSVVFYNHEFLWQTPMGFPGGGGGYLTAAANVGAAQATTNILSGFSNGVPEIHNAFEFDDPLILENNDRVEIDFVNPTGFTMTTAANGGTGCTIYVFLDGKRIRRSS